LHIAVIEGRKECVEILLSKSDITITSKDVHGKTAYDYAVQKGHKEIIDILYQRYEDVVRATGQQIRLPIFMNRVANKK
jgi:ankyrin repeat protein